MRGTSPCNTRVATSLSNKFVCHCYRICTQKNISITKRIILKPKGVIVLDEVPLVNREGPERPCFAEGPHSTEVYPEEDKLPEDGLYRYLLQPGEEHDDQWHRATDRVWSKGTYRLREIIEDAGNRVMYYLKDGPERAFVSEELMLIPEDTELPPDYVQEW